MSEQSTTRVLLACDGATPPPELLRQTWTAQRVLRSHGATRELNLRIEQLSRVVGAPIHPLASDLVRIAAYVYGADQEISRGGNGDPTDAGWRREITLCIPVVAVDSWAQEGVQALLQDTLHFATDDTWHFAFSAGNPEQHTLPMFDEHETLGDPQPDCVLMFSGGADSLCAAVDAVGAHDRHPILVSHRSATYVSAWQRQLVEALRQALPQWRFPHRGCWVQRLGYEAVERTRRSRAFLIASLGAAVALHLNITRVLLADNGVVSLNVSLNGSVVGAQASRSTHPRFLHLFNRLLRAVFPMPVEVQNPQISQTRAEVLSTLRTFQCPELLTHTRSCSRGHGRPAEQPQCGTCSQCIDRRFGVLAAELEDFDPVTGYAKDAFVEALPEGHDRTVGESYLRLGQQLDRTPEDQLFNEFPQLFDAVLPTEPGSNARARVAERLLKRHAANVARVVKAMNARLGDFLWRGEVAPTSLLGLLYGPPTAGKQPSPGPDDRAIWRKVGRHWQLTFRGKEAHVPNTLGVRYLTYLLQTPDTDISVLDLLGHVRGTAEPLGATHAPAIGAALASKDLSIGGTAEVDGPKERAIRRMLRKLDELRTEHDTAEHMGDVQHASSLVDPIERLEKQVSDAYTELLGNSKLGEKYKRQRQAVPKAIKTAIRIIGESHPDLGRHLHRSVRTALFCSYRADPPVHWELRTSEPTA